MLQIPFWEDDTYLVKKFPTLYRTWRLITVFTTSCPFSLSSARFIQSMPSTLHFKIHVNIILPSTPRSSKWPFSYRMPKQNSQQHKLPVTAHNSVQHVWSQCWLTCLCVLKFLRQLHEWWIHRKSNQKCVKYKWKLSDKMHQTDGRCLSSPTVRRQVHLKHVDFNDSRETWGSHNRVAEPLWHRSAGCIAPAFKSITVFLNWSIFCVPQAQSL